VGDFTLDVISSDDIGDRQWPRDAVLIAIVVDGTMTEVIKGTNNSLQTLINCDLCKASWCVTGQRGCGIVRAEHEGWDPRQMQRWGFVPETVVNRSSGLQRNSLT
jgi:hypothetical protein